MRANGVCSVSKSGNEKISHRKGRVDLLATTYVSRASCSQKYCPFMNGRGCYFEEGNCRMIQVDLDRAVKVQGLTILALAREEAMQVDAMTGEVPLRLHTGGDCRTNATARIVSAAGERYTAKHGKPTYTYTHTWPIVDRAAWGKVSVLASCETTSEIVAAHSRGYAVAVVEGAEIADSIKAAGFRLIPCPAQTHPKGTATCGSCRLCMKDKLLHTNKAVISFIAHGARMCKVRKAVAEKRAK